MSTTPPPDSNSPAYPRPASPQQLPHAATQIIVQQPPTAFGRYGRFLILALVICIITIIGQSASYRSYFSPPGGPQERYHSLNQEAEKKIAVIKIEGAILDPEGFVKQQIDRVRQDDSVVAIVLRIDSPGGTVTASDFLYHQLREVARDRQLPIVVSMGGLCASGGYYLAMAASGHEDAIFAEPATWTGSIGVLIPHYNLAGLLERWDVEDDSIASAKDKLMGSPTRKLTPEERERERQLLQELVDRSFERFKKVVTDGRPQLKDDPEKLAEATTGRIFTSEQALELDLVDKIGFMDDAIERAAELANRDPKQLRCVQYEQPPTAIESLLGVANPLGQSGRLDLASLLELTAPRAYYLCTWLPALVGSTR